MTYKRNIKSMNKANLKIIDTMTRENVVGDYTVEQSPIPTTCYESDAQSEPAT